ncbi:MAG TPA: DUF1580 domain-containing protein [Pirellulaceae bacterium]|nr:DUF1580 domain-containing protein [Pirellulaceae bacterium]HMO92275.1 DUF1580 domain-containing protein [Pirellulaceae bacterium]HMP70093.1 DUF1580 domain-containing protein [Pirellulaceae bacterium]
MSSILDQELLSIKQAAKLIPSKPHAATLFRWMTKGSRGHKLQSWLVGGQRFTTALAIEEFIGKLSGGSAPSGQPSKSRQRAIEQAEKELSELGL